MNTQGTNATATWTIVLAAGAGRRLAGVTGNVPKQFWRSGGTSLLEETTRRFAPLAPRSRTIIVVDRTHGPHVASTVGHEAGTVIFQPEDRGTAAGVLLALMPVIAADPDAIVMMTPADHGVMDERGFRSGLRDAARSVAQHGDAILFGVEATEAREDYGWITTGPASPIEHRLRRVDAFVEKPSQDVASRLLASGAAWNTMVLVARARTVRALYGATLPALAQAFDIGIALDSVDRTKYLADLYPRLPRFDFSRDVLTPARTLWAYVWPASIGWSDLGTPERLFAWQLRTGRRMISADPLNTPQSAPLSNSSVCA